jgi:hypothetical protein
MPGDPGRIDPRDEIPLRVAPQRRQGKRGFCDRNRSGAMPVGEVAAPPARDADLFARRLGMVDHQHRRPRRPASIAAIMPAAPAPRK